jgi:tRNA dimethylallyltransferase
MSSTSKPEKAKQLLVVCGPTASGKTALAVQLAQHFSSEIISCDSRQFYKEMSIGTAVPSKEELETPHHFIQTRSVTNAFNVYDFAVEAQQVAYRLWEKHDVIIACGGSGLYIKAFVEGLSVQVPENKKLRKELEVLFENEGIKALQKEWDKLGEELNESDYQNPRRLIRSIEKAQCLDKDRIPVIGPLAASVTYVGIHYPREELYKRINGRVLRMMDDGLLEEVRSLQEYEGIRTLDTVGYREIFAYLAGQYSLEEAVDKIQQNTRRFAKRQMTWFKNQLNVRWVHPENPFEDTLNLLS